MFRRGKLADVEQVNKSLTEVIIALQAEIADLRSASYSAAVPPSQAAGTAEAAPDEGKDDEEELGTCSICMETIYQAATGSCNHHWCLVCLLQYCGSATHSSAAFHNQPERPLCPKCREPILGIRADTEYDALLIAAGLVRVDDPVLAERRRDAAAALALYRVTIHLPQGSHAGVTVSKWKHGPGVRVKSVLEADMAYRCGLREGDVIVSINGMPCRHPDAVTHHLTALSKTATEEAVAMLLLPRPGGPAMQPGARTLNV